MTMDDLAGKTDDEVLAALDPGDTPDPVVPSELAALDKPVVAENPEAEAALADPEPDNSDPGDEAAVEPEPETGENPDYEIALRALRRAKTPGDVIRGLSKEQVIAWGSGLANVQAETDKAYTRLRDLESAPATEENRSGDQTNAPDTAEATDPADLEKVVAALGLDEQEGADLVNFLQERDRKVLEKLSERDQRDRARDATLADLLLEGSRQQLRGQFPGLDDKGKAAEVLSKTRTLFKTGDYESVAAAMEDASTILLGKEAAEAQVAEETKKVLAKNAGRMSRPSSATHAPASMTLNEQFDATLHALESGMTREEAAAAGGW